MDYRNRVYYLVDFGYNDRRVLKENVPTVELHAPYNHLSRRKPSYDGRHAHKTGMFHVDTMVSCDIKYYDALMAEFAKMQERDFGFECYELTKAVCKQ